MQMSISVIGEIRNMLVMCGFFWSSINEMINDRENERELTHQQKADQFVVFVIIIIYEDICTSARGKVKSEEPSNTSFAPPHTHTHLNIVENKIHSYPTEMCKTKTEEKKYPSKFFFRFFLVSSKIWSRSEVFKTNGEFQFFVKKEIYQRIRFLYWEKSFENLKIWFIDFNVSMSKKISKLIKRNKINERKNIKFQISVMNEEKPEKYQNLNLQ